MATLPRFLALLVPVALSLQGCESLKNSRLLKRPAKDVEESSETTDEGVPGGQEQVESPSPTAPEPMSSSREESEFRQACAAQAQAAAGSTVIGRDGWLFDAGELTRVAGGGNVGSAAYRESVESIYEYARQLHARGIQLVVVPVPPKAMVYPDLVSADWKLSKRKVKRFDTYLQVVYADLRAKGVAVVDLLPEMLEKRFDKTGRLYPNADSRWSPRACELAASRIAAAIASAGWLTDDLRQPGISAQEATLDLQGDLAPPGTAAETVPARVVTGVDDSGRVPLLILADGNGSVFASQAAGIGAQLANELRVPFESITTDGDARNVTRTRLLRKTVQSPGSLGGTKAIVWIFNASELYEDDWRRVPVSLELQQSEETLQGG